jgi:uncharacterized protein YkwD
MKVRVIIISAVMAMLLLAGSAMPAAATVNSTLRWRLFLAINETRRAHHLRALHLSGGLRRIAQRHSNDMVRRDYFAHTSPSGSTLFSRVVGSSFQTYGTWWAGENLAWGTGIMGTPRYTIKMWLASPEHRANLLSSRWGWVGIGRRQGRFLGHSNAVVWTADFGHR